VLLEYVDVFSPTTETVPGVEYVIQLKPDADLSQLNRPSFRKSPKELATEREAMEKLLERGIVQPSASCYGTNNVFVEKKRHPDGTSAGIRVTADMSSEQCVSGRCVPNRGCEGYRLLDGIKKLVLGDGSARWILEHSAERGVTKVHCNKNCDRPRRVHTDDDGIEERKRVLPAGRQRKVPGSEGGYIGGLLG
jgi:hypothetical protein